MNPVFDDDTFKGALSRFAAGVTVVTARDGEDKVGMTVSAFSSVSIQPKRLVLVCLTEAKPLTAAVRRSGWYAVNILSREQRHVSDAFAWRPVEERFDGIEHLDGPHGLPIITGALAHLVCRVDAIHRGGDHLIVVGEVVDGVLGDGEPLVYALGAYRALGETL